MEEQRDPRRPLTRRIEERRRVTPGAATTASARAQMRRALWKKGVPAGGWVDRALRGELR